MEQLNNIIFYTMDKSIRTYRQYAQRQLKNAGYPITIDQWLVIKTIMENPSIRQQELGERIFKDNASVTRIIDLLVKGRYLKRKNNSEDRRRVDLEVTERGEKTISDVHKIVLKNRAVALKTVSKTDLETTRKVLTLIIHNCQYS